MFFCRLYSASISIMASRLFSALGKIGIGLAVTGGVVNTALYNGKPSLLSFCIQSFVEFLLACYVVLIPFISLCWVCALVFSSCALEEVSLLNALPVESQQICMQSMLGCRAAATVLVCR